MVKARTREILAGGVTCEEAQAQLSRELQASGRKAPSVRWVNDIRLQAARKRKVIAGSRQEQKPAPRPVPATVQEPADDAEERAGAHRSDPAPSQVSQPKPAPVEPREPAPGLTMADVRSWVSAQLRGLQADVERCTAAGDLAGAASAKRLLTSLAPLAARVALKDPTEDSEFVRVKATEMDAAGLRAREKLGEMLDRAMAERAGWARCSECGQPVRPKEGGEG